MPAIGTVLRALLIPLGGLVAAGAWADQSASRWSVGTQLGEVRSSSSSQGSYEQPLPEPSTMSYDPSAMWGDRNRLGWRVFTGYRFTDYLAVHVGYTDLGKVQSQLMEPSSEFFSGFERMATQKIRGVDVGLQLKIPLSERFAAELRGGKYYWKAQTRADAAEWSVPDRWSMRGSDKFYGAGLEFGLIDDLSATLGWTRYEVADEPVSLWTVGVVYGFGFF